MTGAVHEPCISGYTLALWAKGAYLTTTFIKIFIMKKTLNLLLCLVALMAAALTAHGQASPRTKTYSGGNYTLSYPATWDLDESGKMGTKMLLLSPMESPNDDFRECFNMMTEDLHGQEVSLEEYVEISRKGIETMMTNGKVTSAKKVHQGDRDMYMVNYVGDQGVYKLQFECLIWMDHGTAWILTFCGKKNVFERYRAQAEAVMKSVKVTG